MGKGSGGTNTVTSSAPPQWLQDNLQSLYSQAQNITSQPLSQYQGATVAGFTPAQQSAFNTVNQSQGIAQPYYNQAQNLVNQSTQPLWNGVQQFSPSAVNQYSNPYQQDVINTTQQQLNQNDQIQQQQLLGGAIQSGASPFGGDRAGVAAAQLANQQDLANNQTIAGLENQGYTQALGEFNTQQQNQLGANEQNAYLSQQGAANLANLGTSAQNSALTGANAQLQTGALQQQLGQEALNVPYQQFIQTQAYPYQQLSSLESAAGLAGGLAGGTSTTTPPAPNTASQLGGLGLSGLALYGAMKEGGVAKTSRGRMATYDSGGIVLPSVPDLSISYINTASPVVQKSSIPSAQHSSSQSNTNSSSSPLSGMFNPGALKAASAGYNKLLPGGISGQLGIGSSYNNALAGTEAMPANLATDEGLASLGTPAEGSALLSGIPEGATAVEGLPWLADAGTAALSDTAFDSFLAALALKRGGVAKNKTMRHYDSGGFVPLPAGSTMGVMGQVYDSGGNFIGMEGDSAQTYQPGSYGAGHVFVPSSLPASLQSTYGVTAAPSSSASTAASSGVAAPTASASDIKLAPTYAQFAAQPAHDVVYSGGSLPGASQSTQDILDSIYNTPATKSKKGGIAHYADGSSVLDTSPLSDGFATSPTDSSGFYNTATEFPGMQTASPSPTDILADTATGASDAPTGNLAEQLFGPNEVESQKDAPIDVDHSGDTVKVNYKSEGKKLDLGIPSQTAIDSNAATNSKFDKWEPLLAAGLGIMAGKSPYALTNIGQGGLEGIKNYEQQKKDAIEQQNETREQAAQQETARHNAASEQLGKYSHATNPLTGADVILNTKTGEMVQSGGFGGGASTNSNGSALTGDSYLATLPSDRAAQIKALDEGRMNFPSGFALKSPYYQQLLSQLYTYNPEASSQTAAAVKAFNTGKQGDTVRSLNVGTAHLDTLQSLTDALNNGDTKALNSLKNTIQTQFGATAQPNFDTAKQIVGDEVVKAVLGSGAGSQGDREQLQKNFSSASSPAQLQGVIATAKTLMKGQVDGLRQQYETSTGRHDFDKKLTPAAQKALATLSPSVAVAPVSAISRQTPAAPSGIPSGSQYSPSRNQWRDPQGKLYDSQGNAV